MTNKLDQSLKLTEEDKLLILCARTNLNYEAKLNIIKQLHNNLNWDYLIQRSFQHKITPLLYWNLKEFEDEVPEIVYKSLKESFIGNAKNNLLMLGELFKILNLFDKEGINIIPYKGPLLAISVYKNLALRLFDDLDIFVYKNDVLKIKKTLISNGYISQIQLKGFKEKLYLNFHRDYQFFNPMNHINIEIHWNFIGVSFTLPSNIFSSPKSLRYVKIQNQNVLSLSSCDMLLVLCIHASGHLWERISWICDISEFIQSHKDIEWDELIDKCGRLGFKRILQINILLARDILDLKLSKQIMDKLEIDEYALNLNRDIQRNLFIYNKTQKSFFYKLIMRSKIRENKEHQIKDFFKVLLSQIL